MKFIAALAVSMALFGAVRGHEGQTRNLSQSQKPEKRIALVIGNAAYSSAPLTNPVNDARDIAEALRKCSFEVIYKENLDHEALKNAKVTI